MAGEVGGGGALSLPDNSLYAPQEMQDELPAIADAVRSGDMSCVELAAFLAVACLRAKTAISTVRTVEAEGMPQLHPALLAPELTLESI